MLRPGWFLIANGLLFFAVCLFVCGVLVSGLLHWNLVILVASIVLFFPCFALLLGEYMVVIHGHRLAAKWLATVLLAMGVVLLISAVAALAEPLGDGLFPTSKYITELILPVVFLATWLCWLGLIHLLWQKRLGNRPILASAVDNGASMIAGGAYAIGIRFTLRKLFGLVAAVSVVLAGVVFGIREIPPRHAMHASPHSAQLALPTGASDVCILRGLGGTVAYNFAIDEAGFLEWARSLGGPIETDNPRGRVKAVANPFMIVTCSDNLGSSLRAHTIRRGWFYDGDDATHGNQYAFDADQGRAYYVGYSY